jgi:thioredoxin 1
MAVIEVSNSDFEEKVLKNKTPVLVDFYADWCGPCKMTEPVLEELSQEYKDKVDVVKINVDKNSQFAQKYQVMSIPTTILVKNGQEIGRQVGFAGKKVYEDLIREGIGGDS